MSATITQELQQQQRYQVIHLIAPAAPSTPAVTSIDPILDCLQDMMEEGYVSQRDLATIIELYKALPESEGFSKAILLCRVINKMVQGQIKVEQNELILSHLCECEVRLKELLQDVLAEDIEVEDFLAQYDNRCMQMEADQAKQQKISDRTRLSIQRMNASTQRVEQEIVAAYVVLSGRIASLAQFKSQMTEEQHRKVIELSKRVENARQQTMNHAEEIHQLEERLKQDQLTFNQLTQGLRPLMEKIQKN